MINKWISVSDRLPTEAETLDGRVPILDDQGYLGYAMLIPAHSGHDSWLLCEFDVKYWCAVPPLPPVFEPKSSVVQNHSS